MIPVFPSFKRLALSDKESVEKHTRRLPPYSDFNFINMWSWDTGNTLISELNGNLVVRFADYITAEPFYMFLGTNECSETARILIDRAASEGIVQTLRLIPQCVADCIDGDRFTVSASTAHNDYLFSTDSWCRYEGRRLANRRKNLRRFVAQHPQARCAPLDLGCASVRTAMGRLVEDWFRRKQPDGVLEQEHEYVAFHRALENLRAWFIATGVLVDDRLIGFFLCEDCGNAMVLGHFAKADTDAYPGVFEFMHQESARIWSARGIRYLNHEQDLGLPGLRQSKRAYAPVAYLKKYDVSLCGG